MLQTSILAVLIIGTSFVAANTSAELESIGNQLAGNLPELPINASMIPTQEEAEQKLREKCLKNGGEGAFERAESAKDEMQTCAQSLVNVTELQSEIEVAKPHGDLDSVFRKYCRKSPKLLQCITNFTSALEPCLEEKEKESKRIVQNITEAMLGFICHKEGDRIALFIAERGPECLQSKEEEIKACFNKTVGNLAPGQDATNFNSLPMFVLEEKECNSISDLQICVVQSLEKCSEPTPANIVESLFKFVIKMTPCENLTSSRQQAGKNSGSSAHLHTGLGAAVLLLIGTRLFA